MNKQLIIDKCDDCPFFDNVYYSYEETCTLLDRKIQQVEDSGSTLWLKYQIPNDCPLETSNEDPTKNQILKTKNDKNIMNEDELLEKFNDVQLSFNKYYKYNFHFYAEEEYFSFYGTIGGNRSDSYRLEIDNDDIISVSEYKYKFDYFKVEEINDDGISKIVFEYKDEK